MTTPEWHHENGEASGTNVSIVRCDGQEFGNHILEPLARWGNTTMEIMADCLKPPTKTYKIFLVFNGLNLLGFAVFDIKFGKVETDANICNPDYQDPIWKEKTLKLMEGK